MTDALPDVDALPEILRRLGVAADDARDVIACWPVDSAARDAVHEAAGALRMGDRAGAALPRPPATFPIGRRFFWAYVVLALLPRIRQYHHDHAVPDEISWSSLSVVGSNLARHRRIYRIGGLDGAQWVMKVCRGLVYRLGRLVFERTGGAMLSVHIPPAGPLLPAECDAAIARAPDFFAERFPEGRPAVAHCRSWLLDPQLAEYLPPSANIVRFAKRFGLAADRERSDDGIIRWVFEVPPPVDHAALRPRSALEKAIVRHLSAGGHWYLRQGWFPFDDGQPCATIEADRG